MSELYDTLVGTNDERAKEEERLRALNDQYARLYDALKDQEEYYLNQRRGLNAQWDMENWQTRSVNDMILSPHGAFSTDPKDYIIATKNPGELINGSSSVKVTVNNYSDATVSTEERTGADGIKELVFTVKNIVNRGLANGDFDDGLNSVSRRQSGTRVVHP